MPWVTYTYPEIAQVGLSEAAAREQGIAFQTIEISMAAVDRATTDGETNGFLKIRYQSGTDRILGATLVASHAGDMISEITLAIANNIGLSKLSSVIHPYPTQAEIIKKAADAYRRTLLTGRTQKILKIISKFS
jgi:pyruvate/2-oxoglutarate dehydrogenase complex dihydrolipoamide dehydrogenase (E3) component